MTAHELTSAATLINAEGLFPERGSFLWRLFTSTSGSGRRLEDFMTELLGEALNRLSREELLEAFEAFFFTGGDATGNFPAWRRYAQTKRVLYFRTQFSTRIESLGTGYKRPDIILMGDDVALAIIECKVGAGFTSSTAVDSGKPIQQLEAYGRYLQQSHAPYTALILITQYRDAPDGFLVDHKFKATLRSVRRWSDLERVWRKAEQKIWARTDILKDLFAFVQENELMTDDIRSTDFAAASVYLKLQSHQRLVHCVTEASSRIRPVLQKTLKGKVSTQRRVEAKPDRNDSWLSDSAWTNEYSFSWGFWFGNDVDLASWAGKYRPEWKLGEGVIVAIWFRKGMPDAKVIDRLANWMVSTPTSGEHSAYKLAPFSDFYGPSGSTPKIVAWMSSTVEDGLAALGSGR